jgi:Ca2+-binding EF-hand superfamily protein
MEREVTNEKYMNNTAITTIITLSICFSAFAQEAKDNNWTEEEWKKDKGRYGYGWVFPHIDKDADGKVTAAEYEAFQEFKRQHPNWEIELKANAKPEEKNPTPKKGGSGSPAWVGNRFSTDIPEYKADQPLELLSPETEMAIMRVMNLENRIQTLQTVPVKMTDIELASHFSGTWICFTTMRLNGQLGRGIMQINLKQEGDKLTGDGGQLKHPFDPPSTIRPIGTWSSLTPFIGQFKKAISNRGHNMAVIERQGHNRGTWATFTAVLAGDGRTARGTLVNRGGNYGLMFMVRREFLSDFKHLLTEEGRQAEAKRRWIGIENLELALDTEIMDAARIRWWSADRNRDGKLQYTEFPHPDWKRANRNNDDVVDWAEEVSDRVLRKLAQDGDFLAKHGNDSQKQWPSIYAWGVAHPGFEQIFHFVDWDRDGKITSAEYTAFEDQLNAYNDPSFPKTNQDGKTREDLLSRERSGKKRKAVTKKKPNADPHLVQMEAAFSEEKLARSREMWAALDKNRDNIWQYDEFPHPDWKRANRDGDDGLSWKEELADQMFRKQSRIYPKKYGSTSQKEWPTQQAWNKDRPDFKKLFPFIDWDQDGVITAAEYEVFEVQIKSYTDGSYPKTNEQGETGMEVFKRLAGQPQKAELKPNAKPEEKKPTPRKGGSGSTAWVGDRFSTDIPEYKADQPLELLSPEVELAIMKKLHAYDKIMNIQLMPSNAREDKQADDVTGEWLIFTTMTHGQGMHKLTLKQQGESINGTLEQLIYGPYPWIDSGVLEQIPAADSGKLNGKFTGLFKKTQSKHNMFYLHRTNPRGTFEAIFSAVLSVDGQTATGTLVNTGGMHGMMLMVRRKALVRYKHLLGSDTAQQTELAGTKAPSEASVDGIPRGVKALEASLNKERMAQAVEMFEKLDKNKDGKITVPEVPPKQFKNRAWREANTNGDMILTWEEELIWQYNFQKKKAKKE